MALTLLAQAALPLKYWWDACVSSVFLINRLPTPVLNNVSPFQKLFQLNLIILFLKFLVVLVIPIFALTMLISFNLGPLSVSF